METTNIISIYFRPKGFRKTKRMMGFSPNMDMFTWSLLNRIMGPKKQKPAIETKQKQMINLIWAKGKQYSRFTKKSSPYLNLSY